MWLRLYGLTASLKRDVYGILTNVNLDEEVHSMQPKPIHNSIQYSITNRIQYDTKVYKQSLDQQSRKGSHPWMF
ncbi:hypothetical protein ScPMuIL_003847 [Solemya velum]